MAKEDRARGRKRRRALVVDESEDSSGGRPVDRLSPSVVPSPPWSITEDGLEWMGLSQGTQKRNRWHGGCKAPCMVGFLADFFRLSLHEIRTKCSSHSFSGTHRLQTDGGNRVRLALFLHYREFHLQDVLGKSSIPDAEILKVDFLSSQNFTLEHFAQENAKKNNQNVT